MCENADAESFCAIIESKRSRGRFIIAAKAIFTTQYFVSVSRKSFSHRLGHKRKSSVGLGMSALGGKADIISRASNFRLWLRLLKKSFEGLGQS